MHFWDKCYCAVQVKQIFLFMTVFSTLVNLCIVSPFWGKGAKNCEQTAIE